MAEFDPNPPFQEYAHPERLVSAPWLSARLGIKGLRVIEVDEDSLLYDIGHVPTASRINFQTELLDPVTRDIVSAEGFAQLMRDKGIKRDDTVVIYGDKANWWAAYALWVFELYGHRTSVSSTVAAMLGLPKSATPLLWFPTSQSLITQR